MATLASITHTPEKTASESQTKKISDYEKSREDRIKENLERMQKLGIVDLSLKLKSLKPAPRSTPSTRRTLVHSSPIAPPGPTRRSSRLQNVTPVSYSEVHLTNKDYSLEGEDDLLREVGSKPELYTEVHEKLLGSTEKSWTLFVDGCGRDGKRIYDPVNGKTCHQCRQKTLGYRTHCSKCNMVQGQFCGDCLFMRYGEHVLEANQNPNWICPVCRGICNCSLCRQAKGWPPTGTLYRKISKLGFKSVAHYLIQTQRSNSDSEMTSGNSVPISAKRSLPFSNSEEMSKEKESSELDVKSQGLEYPLSEGNMTDICLDDGKTDDVPFSNAEETSMEKESSEFDVKPQRLEYPLSEGKMTDNNCLVDGNKDERVYCLDNELGNCGVNPESNSEIIIQQPKNCKIDNPLLLGEMRREADLHVCTNILRGNSAQPLNKLVLPKASFDQEGGTSETEPETSIEKLEVKKDDKIFSSGKREFACSVAAESTPKSNKKRGHTSEPDTDSVAGRLRQRRKVGNRHDEEMSTLVKNGTPAVTPVAVKESFAGRLKERRGKENEHEEKMSTCETSGVKQHLNNVSSSTRLSCHKKRVCISVPSPDSIAGRLRPRRGEGRVV